MADGQKPYRVRDGAILPHAGAELLGGTVVQLKPEIAYEVRHLVEPIGDDGQVQPWGAASDAKLEADLATARSHERISILEDAIAVKAGELERLRKMHSAEVEAGKAAAKALEKKPEPAKPAAGKG
jgi:hypothetical protein